MNPEGEREAHRGKNGTEALEHILAEEVGEYGSKQAYALFHNIVGLWTPWSEHRLLFLTLTFAEDVDPSVSSKAVATFVTNRLSPSHVAAWARATGRTQKGRLHHHFVLVMEAFHGLSNPSGVKRLNTLRTKFAKSWAKWGSLNLEEVEQIGGVSRYLADQVAAAEQRRSADKQKGLESAWKGIRLTAYSERLDRVVWPEFQWTHGFDRAFRSQVAALGTVLGHAPNGSLSWMGRYRLQLMDLARGDQDRFEEIRDSALIWKFDRMSSLGNRAPRTIYPTVFVLAESLSENHPPFLFSHLLWRQAEGAERYLVSDPRGAGRVWYENIAYEVTKAELNHIRRVQPRCGPLEWWLLPRSGVRRRSRNKNKSTL